MQYSFMTPDEQYRGLDLYMVNDKLEDDEIRHQIREFRDKGLYSVIFRTYNGLISDYPGPMFKHSVAVAIDEARSCGLKICLQAGYMPSAYAGLPIEYTLHKIVPMPLEEAQGEQILQIAGDLAYVDKPALGSLDMLSEEATNFYIKHAYEEMWQEFADEYGKTVISVWVDEPRFSSLNLPWSPVLPKAFLEKYGYRLEENIDSLYHDTGDYKKIRYDFFVLLRELMTEVYYKKVRTWCHANGLSFSGHLMGEENLAKMASQAIAVMPFYKYFDIPGVDMLRTEQDWYDHPLISQDMACMNQVSRSTYFTPIQVSSAAEQAGQKHVLCEMYGVTSPSLTFRDQMHHFDFFAAHGINHQCMHALFYSIGGFRKRFYPQQFNVYQPFWENFRNIKDYVARVSAFNSMGHCTQDVLVFHPLETAYGLFRGLLDPSDSDSAWDIINDYDDSFYQFMNQLYAERINYHFGDLQTIEEEGAVEGNMFRIGKMVYRTVVLPELETLNSAAVRLLKDFAANGGQIHVLRSLPTRLDGQAAPALADELAKLPGLTVYKDRESLMRVLKALDKGYVYQCASHAGQVSINRRVEETPEGKLQYIMLQSNDCREAKRGTLTLPGIYEVTRYDAERNLLLPASFVHEDGSTVIDASLEIGGATMLIARENASALSSPASANWEMAIPVSAEECRLDGPNLMTLEYCTYKTEQMDDFSKEEIVIEHLIEKLKREAYSGMITMRFSFDSEFEAKNLTLLLEEASKCTVRLNGVDADMTDCGFYQAQSFRRIQLPDAVRIGTNTLDITRKTSPKIQGAIVDTMDHLFELFRAPVGVDLERVHLLGDFTVGGIEEFSLRSGISRYARHFVMRAPEPMQPWADLTAHGYPFTPEAATYRFDLDVAGAMLEAKEIALKIGRFSGCSSIVFINGEKVGSIDKEPYCLPIKQALKEGTNTVEIRLLNTLRNMIGPSHQREIDDSGCSTWTWLAHMDEPGIADHDTLHLTHGFQLTPYGIGDLSLIVS